MMYMKSKFIIVFLLLVLLLVSCKEYGHNGQDINENNQNVTSNGENKENESQVKAIENFEGQWNRTQVASYEQATIEISNWVEDESFDLKIQNRYSIYSSCLEGKARFVDDSKAIFYDENLKEFLNDEIDSGIYVTFSDNSINITHAKEISMYFGGGGVCTAEGMYVKGEPEYTNYSDVNMLFSEDELTNIKGVLGESYEPLFKDIIELGEVEIKTIDGGRMWEAYWPPYEVAWCKILIYNDGRVYIEGCPYGGKNKEFYTNSKDTKMPY